MKGRRPKSAEQRRRDGQTRHEAPAQPVIVGGRLDEGETIRMPPYLSRFMRAVWRVVIDDMRQGGILDRADLVTVEQFAVALGRAREIRAYLKTLQSKEAPFGHLLADTVRGTMAHPLLAKEKDFLTEARQVGEHLGLSPVARTRLGLDAKGSLKPKSMEGELGRKIGVSPRLIQGGRPA